MPTGWDFQITVPADKKYPPEVTHQAYLGVFTVHQLGKGSLQGSVGGYYRHMQHLVAYTNPLNAFELKTRTWMEEVDRGRGTSYGMELSAQLNIDRCEASLAYTWSKTDRTFPLLNQGRSFPFKFDRRHILHAQGSYTFVRHHTRKGKLREHLLLAGVDLTSGHRITITSGEYPGYAPPHWVRDITEHPPVEYNMLIYSRPMSAGKNAVALKDYFRLDVGYSFRQRGRRFTHDFTLGVYNVTNRHNPYALYYENYKWKQISIMPILPSLHWALSW